MSDTNPSNLQEIDLALEANRLRQKQAAAAILAARQLQLFPAEASSSILNLPNTTPAVAATGFLQSLDISSRIPSLRELEYVAALQQRHRQQQQQPQISPSLPAVSALPQMSLLGASAGDFGLSSPSNNNAEAAALAPKRKRRGGVSDPFPCKLHRILSEVESDGLTDIISWLPHGRAFAIHKPEKFVSDIMPKYFRMSSLSSLQRQLNLYNFKRITDGADRGAYYHRQFLRGKPDMAKDLKRTKTKRNFVHTIGADGVPVCVPRGMAALYEPNFYSMPTLDRLSEEQQQQQRLRDLTKCGATVMPSCLGPR